MIEDVSKNDSGELVKYEFNIKVREISDAVPVLKKQAEKLVVSDAQTEGSGSDIIKTARSYIAEIEKVWDCYSRPLLEEKRKVDGFFKAVTEPFKEIRSIIDNKLRAYAVKLEEERRKQEAKNAKKIEKAIEQGKPMPVINAVETHTAAVTGQSRTSYVKEWKHQIINDKEVPREYCVPNDSIIRAAVKAGQRNIPGVRIYEDVRTVNR